MTDLKRQRDEAKSEDDKCLSDDFTIAKWVKETPKCQKCGFFISLVFGGLRNEYVYPHCSNQKCPFFCIQKFICPEMEQATK